MRRVSFNLSGYFTDAWTMLRANFCAILGIELMCVP